MEETTFKCDYCGKQVNNPLHEDRWIIIKNNDGLEIIYVIDSQADKHKRRFTIYDLHFCSFKCLENYIKGEKK